MQSGYYSSIHVFLWINMGWNHSAACRMRLDKMGCSCNVMKSIAFWYANRHCVLSSLTRLLDVCDFLSIHVFLSCMSINVKWFELCISYSLLVYHCTYQTKGGTHFFRKANIFHAYFGSKFGNERGSCLSPMRTNMRSVSLLFSGEVSCAFISSAIQLLEWVEYAYLCMRSTVACCGGRVNAFFCIVLPYRDKWFHP